MRLKRRRSNDTSCQGLTQLQRTLALCRFRLVVPLAIPQIAGMNDRQENKLGMFRSTGQVLSDNAAIFTQHAHGAPQAGIRASEHGRKRATRRPHPAVRGDQPAPRDGLPKRAQDDRHRLNADAPDAAAEPLILRGGGGSSPRATPPRSTHSPAGSSARAAIWLPDRADGPRRAPIAVKPIFCLHGPILKRAAAICKSVPVRVSEKRGRSVILARESTVICHSADYATATSTYSAVVEGFGIGSPSSRKPSRSNSIAPCISVSTSGLVRAVDTQPGTFGE